MKIRCKYCGEYIESTDKKCKFCGKTNQRDRLIIKPKTIKELEQWALKKELVPISEQSMTIFNGKIFCETSLDGTFEVLKSEKDSSIIIKKYSIYKDELGNTVLCKFKNSKTKIILYEGKNEMYAVNKLYANILLPLVIKEKIKEVWNEVTLRFMIIAMIILFIMYIMFLPNNHHQKGYYNYNGTYYYYQLGIWYQYDYGNKTWIYSYSTPGELTHKSKSYYKSLEYDYYPIVDFESSQYYRK